MITITLRVNDKDTDIMVLPEQRISEVLKVLKENHMIFFQIEKLMVYSVCNKEYVNQKLTFRQAEVYSGDILVLK